MDVSENSGTNKNHPFFWWVFHDFDHPFGGTPIFGNTHIYIYIISYHIISYHIPSLQDQCTSPPIASGSTLAGSRSKALRAAPPAGVTKRGLQTSVLFGVVVFCWYGFFMCVCVLFLIMFGGFDVPFLRGRLFKFVSFLVHVVFYVFLFLGWFVFWEEESHCCLYMVWKVFLLCLYNLDIGWW